MFDDHIVVESPGKLTGLVRDDNIRYSHLSRNPQIAEYLKVLGLEKRAGAMLGMFKRDYPERNYTGVDFSEKMIETANKKHITGIRFVAGDCENMPFADNSFDVVTCSMSFHHYPDPERFFMSLHRVLRPGGRFILRDMASNSRLVMWFMNHIEIPIGNKVLRKGDVHVYSRIDIQRLCDAGGLQLELYEVRKGFRLHCVVRKPL